MAQKNDAAVVLMYVAVDLCRLYPAYGNYPSTEHLNNFRDWELGQARKKLEQLCEEKLKACPYLRLRLVSGEPAEEILKTAKQEHADLIVLTRKGTRSGTWRDLGDMERQVIKSTDIPVQILSP